MLLHIVQSFKVTAVLANWRSFGLEGGCFTECCRNAEEFSGKAADTCIHVIHQLVGEFTNLLTSKD